MRVVGYVALGCAAVIALVVFLGAMGFLGRGIGVAQNRVFRPVEIETDRQSNQQSQQYVETKRQLLLGLVQDVRRLDDEISEGQARGEDVSMKTAQKKATLDRMEQEAQALPPDQVPAPARDVLAKSGRYL